MKKTFIIITLSLIISNLFSQDMIYTTDEQQMKVDIIEIGANEIKYYKYKDDSGIIFGISKSDVVRIKLEDGEQTFFTETPFNPKFYQSQRTKIIKVAPFSPLFGHLGLGYEQMIKPGLNYEVGLGIIGLGYQGRNSFLLNGRGQSWGAFTKAGIKVNFKKDYYIDGMKYYNVMQSWYARFDVIVSHVTFGRNDVVANTYTGSGAVNINLGKQWVLGERMALDIYAGFGYGFTWGDERDGYYYSHIASNNPPLSLTSGFKIGYLIK